MKLTWKLFLLFSVLGRGMLVAQTEQDLVKEFAQGEKFLAEGKYKQAAATFLHLDSLYPGNHHLAYKTGYSLLHIPHGRQSAVPFLLRATTGISPGYKNQPSEQGSPPEAWFMLGQAYHFMYDFDKAISAYTHYRTYLDEAVQSDRMKEIEQRIAMCHNGKLLVSTPVKIELFNLGAPVNTQYDEYAPVISADEETMIFTSTRPAAGSAGTQGEMIYITSKENGKWTAPKEIGKPVSSTGKEKSAGLSADGQKLFIYKSSGEDIGELYVNTLEGDKWSDPVILGSNFREHSWQRGMSMSSDGQVLYLSSEDKDGYGGRDIYFSRKLPNGSWGTPVNLGPAINTPYDDDGPFIHADGRTLFYSSKGHNSMGGFDVFFSVRNEQNEWETPLNIGYPINSSDDDIYYVLSADGKRAYYSSYQAGGLGEKDIYMANFPEFREKPLALIKGIVTGFDGGVPTDVEIVVTDVESGELAGVYYPNSKSGKYLFILPPGKKYDVSYQASGYLMHTEILDVSDSQNYYEIKSTIDLDAITVGAGFVLRGITFSEGTDKITARSESELKTVQKLLNLNPGVKVEIAGHTETGNDASNLKLSAKQARAVVEELEKMGVPAERMVWKGYGGTLPLTADRRGDGTTNPAGVQANRRIEVKILATE